MKLLIAVPSKNRYREDQIIRNTLVGYSIQNMTSKFLLSLVNTKIIVRQWELRM